MVKGAAKRPAQGSEARAAPRERLEFKKLLATNPNYFGNLEQSPFNVVQEIVGNTTFEEISCIGYNPALELLEATIHIKNPGGYNGTLCTPGSTEYVRFFVDYGGGWNDVGFASFNAHDIPNTADCAQQPDKPLSFVVTLPLDPQRNFCSRPLLPRVRAILSWQLLPPAGNPNWAPVWGNVVNRHIQIKPRWLWFGDIVELLSPDAVASLPPLIEQAKPFPIPLPDPPPLPLPQLAQLYRTGEKTATPAPEVEPHRFGLSELEMLVTTADQEKLLAANVEWNEAGIDLGAALTALDQTQADVSYEELDCLGLEYNLDRLIATFRIKRPSGYSGDLCSSGSQEYVAFWADWNDTCDWTYLNTVAVQVHDISSIPPEGLVYSAILPVDLNAVRRPCGGPLGGPKIARVRAVLSWNVPPSTADPDALNHWGNRLDAHVLVRPGVPNPGNQPVISILGGIGVADIDIFGTGMTKPTATFALGGSPADPWLNRECPFGGLIVLQGPPVLGSKYRVWARKSGDPATEEIVKNPFHVVNWLGVGSLITPDSFGYVAYMDTLSNINQVLAHWRPAGDDLWEIRVEMIPLGGGFPGSTAWHRVQLDNTAPRRRPAFPPFEPPEVTCEIHIDSGGDCKDFATGTSIAGRFVARDAHMGYFSLTTLPTSILPHKNPTTGTLNTSNTTTFVAGGDAWQLDTTNMQPCGYVVLLQVWDRSIVNSHPGSHNSNTYDVGFCLRS